jgi:hypothetical protein
VTERRDNWRPRPAAALLLLLFFAGAPVFGQTLDLPRRVEPPPLGDDSAAMVLWRTLEQEIAPLVDRERLVPAPVRPAIRASITYRIIAADMLARGHQAGHPGSLGVLVGARLADHREAIDSVIGRAIQRPPPSGAAAALAALVRFNDGAVDLAGMPDPTDASELDENLRTLLEPLAGAITLLGGGLIESHWPRASEVVVPGALLRSPAPEAPPPAVTLGALRAGVTGAPLRDDIRVTCEEIVDFLERGAAFPDLAPAAREYGALLARAIDLAAAREDASWLTRDQRDHLDERLHQALLLFRDPATRERGREKLNRLESTRQMILRISVLSRRGVDLESIRAGVLSLDEMASDPAAEQLSRQQLARVRQVLDRMIAFRELEKVSLRREMRQVEQQLRRRYLEAEDALVRDLETLAANPGALADPAFSSLLSDHAQLLEDLERMRRMPQWVEAIAAMNDQADGPFGGQARKMSQWLLDDNRRPDAIRAIDQFEQQLALFAALPFEEELSRPSPELAAVTGGREGELLAVIRNGRHDWAAEWGQGNAGGGAAARMLALHRLLQAIADVVELGRLGDDASALNRWAAWFMPRGAETQTIDELRNRLKLATDAAVSGDGERLLRQLDRMDQELPVVRLVGRLAKVLAPSLRSLPTGAAAAMGQSIKPPPPDAWWLERRTELADLCRYAMERDHAGAQGETELESRLSGFINALADDLLRAVGERRGGPPTLIGFDGSDPDASDIDAPVRRR